MTGLFCEGGGKEMIPLLQFAGKRELWRAGAPFSYFLHREKGKNALWFQEGENFS